MSTKTLGQLADEGAPVCMAFHHLKTLCERRGWIPIGFRRIELPDGIIVTVNGTTEDRPDEIGMDIPPFHASVIASGWPGGIFTMFGGTMVGGVEERLIAALEKALSDPAVATPTDEGKADPSRVGI